jgi:uncharacterized protein YjbI with pentapeptide repeats
LSDAQLRKRWRGEEGRERSEEAVARLLAGERLDGLGLGEHEGRIDLRGLTTPPPERLRRFEKFGIFFEELGDMIELRDARLEGLDLSAAVLDYLRFFRTGISDCRFEDARCQRLGLWAVDVTDTSFQGADLRRSALGPWFEGRGNVYRNVDFSRADMRDIGSSHATYIDCDLSHARLDEVEFGGSSFVRCRFAGVLRDVLFYDRTIDGEKPDPNPMEDVDFTDAELIFCDFRNLDLKDVKLPTSPDQIIVRDYPCVLRRASKRLKGDERPVALGLLGLIENGLDWLAPGREVGIYHREEFADKGPEAVKWVEQFLRELEAECAEEAERRPLNKIKAGAARLLARER